MISQSAVARISFDKLIWRSTKSSQEIFYSEDVIQLLQLYFCLLIFDILDSSVSWSLMLKFFTSLKEALEVNGPIFFPSPASAIISLYCGLVIDFCIDSISLLTCTVLFLDTMRGHKEKYSLSLQSWRWIISLSPSLPPSLFFSLLYAIDIEELYYIYL